MRKRLNLGRYLVSSGLVWSVGCGFDADLPNQKGSTAPVNSAVTLSAAGTGGTVGSVAGSKISDIRSENGPGRMATDPTSAAADAGAMGEGSGTSGGAPSHASGAAGTGGKVADPTNQSDAGEAGDGGATNNHPAEPPELWFSEYVEGSSSNKALEITTAKRAVLDGCKVGTYFNGKTEVTIVASLSGVLEAGQVITLCTSTLKEKLADTCNQVGNLTFNGDDAIALSCEGKILDVIGQLGVDPGTAWGNEPTSTIDHTLRRKCAVQNGDSVSTDVFDPSAEWQAFPIDTFDGLGTPGC